MKGKAKAARLGQAPSTWYGTFYRPDAVFRLPVYLDQVVETYLAKKTKAKGVELSDLVNELLKKEIEIIEAVK